MISTATKNIEWGKHRDRPLMIAGLVLLIIGILRFYNVDWPVVLMVVGVILLIKGTIIKMSRR